MSGNLSVVAFEGELNAIVKEYLDFSGLERTGTAFETECNEKGKPIQASDVQTSLSSQKQQLAQKEMMDLFAQGQRDFFFKLWSKYLPPNLRLEDTVAQKLEFYLSIHFAIYPVCLGQPQEAVDAAMNDFKRFLETGGATLSQTTEFLPFYALPYVPNLRNHQTYRDLFSESWVRDLESRLNKFLTLALKSRPQPRLFDLYRGAGGGTPEHQRQILMLQQQLLDAEKKTATYVKRHNKVQADYHNLIGITADLIDALEATIQGRPITPEYLQQLCNRLFAGHMRTSLDMTRPGTAGEALRNSIAPSRHQEDYSASSGLHGKKVAAAIMVEESYPVLDYNKVKKDLATAPDRKKALMLQALRWRLTRSRMEQREGIMASYIQNDLLGCEHEGPYQDAILKLLTAESEVVRQYAARLFNAFASISAGRSYLALNQHLLAALMSNLQGEDKDSLTREMVLGALQKLSLRRAQQSSMIEKGVIEWLVGVLEDNDALSDYTLEYSVALLMNLCLRTSGKKRCVHSAHQTLKVLSDLLGHDNQEIRPYVNGALYSILAIPSIKEEAKAMGMEEILRCFIKEDQHDMNRQVEFIIKQLNSNETGDGYESDDEDEEEDEEEDQDALEADIDKEELLRPQPGEASGEKLLTQEYIGSATTSAARKKRHVDAVAAMHEPLQRPTTPSQRRGVDATSRTRDFGGEDRPRTTSSQAGKDIIRPPTRSGSRPTSQESLRVDRLSVTPKSGRQSSKSQNKPGSTGVPVEYKQAFSARPKIPRTPDVTVGARRPGSRGSISREPPQPQFSQSGPRPSSAGKSASGSTSPRKPDTPQKQQ